MIPRAVRVGVLGTRTAVNALSANGSRRVATPQSFPHVRRVCATAGACARDSKDLPEDGACVMDATPASGPRHRKLGTGPELREFVTAAGASGGLPCSAATFVPVRTHSSVAHAKVADGADDGSQVKSKMPRAAKGRESARSAANKVVRTPVEDLPPSSHIDTVHTYSWTQENEYDPLGTQDAYKKFCDPAFYAWSRLPPTEAYTIPPVAYYHEKFFGIEKNRLFARAWVAVGVSDQVREWGDTFITNVAGQPLFVARSKDGEVGCRVCVWGGGAVPRSSACPRITLRAVPCVVPTACSGADVLQRVPPPRCQARAQGRQVWRHLVPLPPLGVRGRRAAAGDPALQGRREAEERADPGPRRCWDGARCGSASRGHRGVQHGAGEELQQESECHGPSSTRLPHRFRAALSLHVGVATWPPRLVHHATLTTSVCRDRTTACMRFAPSADTASCT